MALELFVNCTNDLLDFESIHAEVASDENIHSLEVLRVELNSLWDQVKRSYNECRDTPTQEGAKPIDKDKLRERYKKALAAYKNCFGALNFEIQALVDKRSQEKLDRISATQPQCSDTDSAPVARLPPCDTNIFQGDYSTWPTFRDLFSAIYIRNSKLSKVEKLFHLTQKTTGEAREIISHVPLTNDGFDIAWKNLVDRYENKRMLVNDQLKTLFNLPQVSMDAGSSIKKLQRTVNSCIQTLTTMNVNTNGWDPILVYLSSTKLPRKFLEDFEDSLSDCSKIPTWDDFDSFLTHKFKTLESVGNIQQNNKSNQPRSDKNYSKEKRINTFQTNLAPQNEGMKTATKTYQGPSKREPSCQLCKSNHSLGTCSKFLEKNINDRIHFVKISYLCYNCLSSDHGVQECRSRFSCRRCRQRHNTLLHKGNETRPTGSEPTRDAARPSTSAAALTTIIQSTPNEETPRLTSLTLQESNCPSPQHNRETLLFTALVQIETKGQRYNARAIIDPGSQSTFISEKLTNRLKLPTKRNLVHVTGLNQTVSETSTRACLFTLCSRLDPSIELEVWAPVLKTLPSNLPPRNLEKSLCESANLELADPHFNESRPIELLIGLDLGPLIYDTSVPMRSIESLLAQKTVFGWIVGGPITINKNDNNIALCNTVAIEKILTRFWEVEETPKKVLRSEEDTFCEENFKTTTRRSDTGRYIVTLPFKPCEELGTSRNIALAQFNRMEKKLTKTPEIKSLYDKTIIEYLELGHMRKISPSEIEKTPNYYLPHHAVIKPDRLTTKLRVVFNASSPSSNKLSLNDILYPGPILQQDLVLQILKWRFFKYVFNADVTKMYRQILVDPAHTKYQRILYRLSPNDPVEDFEIQTVTFGVNCAPYLALRVLIALAEDIKEIYPRASKIILQNLYVDDVLAGCHSLEDSIKSRDELIAALASAGFQLMKWTSNDPRVLKDLPSGSLLPVNWLNISEGISTKTLGIRWNISQDSFTFSSPNIQTKPTYTKREVLSTIAKLFDPCGWLAPVVVVAKIIMQQIWLDKIDWDDILKLITAQNWLNFVTNSHTIDSIMIPRWIQYTCSNSVEIHGFCDASEKAYAAAIYVRIQNADNSVHTFLLGAKTRVAPIKNISLPRLELCGAVLLSKLTASIVPNLQINNLSTHFWTDSTIVLAWLRKPACSWNAFVGNRVSEIVENVGNNSWKHVDSEHNPADIASRGCSPAELRDNNLWWYGPAWLKLHQSRWPSTKMDEDTSLEAKPIKVFTTTTVEDPLARFSSLPRAYRVWAYVLRFWRNTSATRTHLRITTIEITAEEIQDVKSRLITWTQKQYFPDEYHSLTQKQRIAPKSSLLTLNPFLDSKNVLRANGRLTQSPVLSYSERHPIILPYDSRFAQLTVEFTHKITIHGGNQLMTRVLRTEFWIFRLKSLVKKVTRNCKTCIIFKHNTQNQIMSSLPPERTLLDRPFTNTGVDYAGPFNIKSFTGRACLVTKGYVCIFVCFATKAIHLEAASDLSTQAFLAALSRFIGRRGCPARIYSDNGTNFVGAAELIKKERLEFMKTLQISTTQQHSHQSLEWKFIPPGAPHMGGLWEAGVKSFKTHLRKLIPNMTFTFEEFSTILARIESCLNSRPLSPASDDPNDLSPLTPGHFLVGTPILAPAELDISDDNPILANRWKRLRIVSQNFCQRWKTEYLNELHRRYKWKYQRENIKINDLIVIKDDRLSPNEWKLGRIVKTYPGIDQNIRVVDIRTSSGIVSRPITKIVKLFSD